MTVKTNQNGSPKLENQSELHRTMLKERLEIKDYTLKTFFGKGSFGEVRLAEKRIEIADKKVLTASRSE